MNCDLRATHYRTRLIGHGLHMLLDLRYLAPTRIIGAYIDNSIATEPRQPTAIVFLNICDTLTATATAHS